MRSTGIRPFRHTLQAMAACACRCGSRRTSMQRILTARRFTFTSVALIALAGCGATHDKPLRYRDLSNELHGFQPPRLVREAFKTRASFVKYLRHESPGIRRIPKIDWVHREAILVS